MEYQLHHNGLARDFLPKDELEELWQECCASSLPEDLMTSEPKEMLQDVLDILEAEGEVLRLRDGAQVHINPTWLVSLLKPLADHRLNEPNNPRRQQVLTIARARGATAKALDVFCATGALPYWLLQVLWATELPAHVVNDEHTTATLIGTATH